MNSNEFARFKTYRAGSKTTAKKVKTLKLNKSRFVRRSIKQMLKSADSSYVFAGVSRIKDDCRNLL